MLHPQIKLLLSFYFSDPPCPDFRGMVVPPSTQRLPSSQQTWCLQWLACLQPYLADCRSLYSPYSALSSSRASSAFPVGLFLRATFDCALLVSSRRTIWLSMMRERSDGLFSGPKLAGGSPCGRNLTSWDYRLGRRPWPGRWINRHFDAVCSNVCDLCSICKIPLILSQLPVQK